MATKLVVFDLDQTLVDFIATHDETTHRLFKNFFGVDAWLTEIDFGGRSLRDSFARLGALKGVPEAEVRRQGDAMLACYDAIFPHLLPREDAAKCVLPGVIDLLESLFHTGDILALYTGDSAAVAQAMLAATGLGKYFRLCFYGTESLSRADMVRQAALEASRLAGKTINGNDIVIIGDSLRDIEAAREVGAIIIAVATGFHTPEQLRARRPDYLFPDLSDVRSVLRIINGTGNPA